MLTDRRQIITLVLIFLLSFGLYANNASHFETTIHQIGKGPLGTDTRTSARAMDQLRYPWKHPLFSVTTAPLVNLLKAVFPLSTEQAITLVVALIAAINIVLAYLILQECIVPPLLAAWFSGIYALLFSNLIIFSVPETYATSNLVILAYLWLFLRKRDHLARQEALMLGALVGIASLFNPPLLSLGVIHMLYSYHRNGFKEAVRLGSLSLLVAGLLFLMPHVLLEPLAHQRPFLSHAQKFGAQYTSSERFLEWRAGASVLLSFLWYSIVLPIDARVTKASVNYGAGYFEFPDHMIFLVIYTVFMLAVLVRAACEKNPLVIAFSGWMGVMTLFYLYFNPPEALLYSPQILFPLTLVLAQGFAKITPIRKWKYYMLGLCSLYLATHNIHVLYNWT